MSNPNPNWHENLHRYVVVKCKMEYCDNLVRTNVGRASQGVYCPDCAEEAKTITRKNYDERRNARRRRERQVHNATCLWPGCEETFRKKGKQLYCMIHKRENYLKWFRERRKREVQVQDEPV